MTVKLTEVATQRFIDNITSITPGALKGGIRPVARHPEARRDRRRRLGRHAQGLPDLPPDGPRHRRRLQPDPRASADARPGLQRRRSAPTASGSPPAAASTARARSTSARTSSTPTLPDEHQGDHGQGRRRRGRPRRDARSTSTTSEGVKLIAKVELPQRRRLRRRLPARRQARRRRRGRRQGPADRRRERHGRQGVRSRPARRPATAASAAGGRSRPPVPEEPAETETLPAGATLDAPRGPARRDRARRAASPTRSCSSPARLDIGRDGRRDPAGRVEALGRRGRGLAERAWSGPGRRPGRRSR